jgi:hypothetical protein
MSATFRLSRQADAGPLGLAMIAGLACAFAISEALPLAMNVVSAISEPPGATHLVSANASNTEPAELIAVFVADEGAQLTTPIE